MPEEKVIYQCEVSDDGKYLELISNESALIQFNLANNTFSSFRLSDLPGDVLLDYVFFVINYIGREFKIYNVKNYSGYTRETFSSHDRANDYLKANDKGDKDLCISSQTVNRTPFNFNMLGVETGRYKP